MDTHATIQQWIDEGYEAFSDHGPEGIKVQSLARKMGVSKSSYYHHFGDQEGFIESLLEKHLEIAKQFAAEVKHTKVFDPDFIDLMMKYRSAVFFQQKLRINSESADYGGCYEQVTEMILKDVLEVWAGYMGISSDMNLAKKLYLMIITLFYERVRKRTFNPEWIRNMLEEVKRICKRVKETKSVDKPPSDIGH